ncbi:hypothetical protein M9H77_32982 [Catharanthus roseus]|uniref:Uncharacterized protein n=1 Tax=Catharanthus roseus TaxID=4058 RepID=A0ACC0A4F3_CATRO|nr:hypothetical protein M9H77_32982 [Catharanthus roseus]
MSTATAVVPVAGEALEKPPRKFPPPCWTQEETLALIDAYRERWYALRRGYLRTADWDAVAAAVTNRCPDASPAKTSAQCRHKMEKLRQRYRAEKQRSLAFPTGRFFSTWFFFENMDAMENGTSVSAVKSNQGEPDNRESSGNGFRLKSLIDQNVVKLKLKPKNATKFDVGLSPNFAIDAGRGKNSSKTIDGKANSDFGSTALNEYSPYLDLGSDKEEDEMEFEGGLQPKNQVGGLSVPTTGFRGKNFSKVFGDIRNDFQLGSVGSKGFDANNLFHAKPLGDPLGDESLLPPRYRAKKLGKIDGRISRALNSVEEQSNANGANSGLWGRVASDRNSLPLGGRGKYGANLDAGLDFRGLNGFSIPFDLGVEKKGEGGGGVKRERDPIDEMVSSIKMLGEGFMKMEKMKMEMAMEIEKNRMEMEMKRNELILDSQRQILDAFIKGVFEAKNKKMKLTDE